MTKTAAALSLLALLIGPAGATTLDFSGAICATPTGACSVSNNVSQSYGDIPGQLDVVYDRDINEPGTHDLIWMPSLFSGLVAVATGPVNQTTATAEIVLKPLAGYSVTLTGFQLGARWTDRATQWTVSDLVSGVLTSSGAITVSHITPTTVTNSWTSANGLSIRFGPTVQDVGIDNITFSVAAVPGPVAGAGLPVLAGFAAWAWRRRRRIAAG